MNTGTLAYGTLAGIGFGIGLVFVVAGLRRSGARHLELAIGFLGLSGAAASITIWQLQSSDDVDQYATILKGPFAVASLTAALAVVWVVAVVTSVGFPRLPLALTAATVAIGVTNSLLPNGLIVDEITGLRNVTLFGESFVVHEPSRPSWRPLLDGYLLAVAAYVVAALVLQRRRAGRANRPLIAGVTVTYAVFLFDSLVDEGVVNTPYLAPFGLIAFAVGVSVQHARHLIRTELQLTLQSANLEILVASRTESLRTANQRILTELNGQEQTVGRITRLTREFTKLGALHTDDVAGGRLERTLADSIRCVGEVVDASSARLECIDADRGDLPAMSIEWSASPTEAPVDADRVNEQKHTLSSGDRVLGELVLGWDGHVSRSAVQQRLVDLSTEFLSIFLRRLELESSLLDTVLEAERQRIARDLHDSMSQRLYAAAFNADVLTHVPEDRPELAASQAITIRNLVLSSLAEMRTLLFELQPDTLESTPLDALIRHLCQSMEETYDHPIEIESHPGQPVPPAPKLAMYRIVQESLGNALRHSQASRIAVSVDISDENVTIEIKDDGVGFDPLTISSGHGLANTAERAREIGAELDIASSPGSGTAVSASWSRPRSDEPLLDLTSPSMSESAGL